VAGGLGRAAAQAAAVLLLRRADRRLERGVVFAAADGGAEGLRALLASGAAGTAGAAVTGGGRTALAEGGFGRVELEVLVSTDAGRPGGPFFAASGSREFWEELGAAPREVPAAGAEVLELGRAVGAAAGLDLPLTEEEWAARGTPRERVVEGALAWLAYALNRWLDEEAGAPWWAASGEAEAPRQPAPEGAQPGR
jgi:hypothetical protein